VSLKAESSAVDADTIATLREDGSLLRELRDLFLTEAADQLGKMAEARRQSDAKVLAMAAHRLKGSAVTFGAEELRRLCVELEQAAQSGSLGDLEGMIQQVQAECDRVKLALDEALSPTALN
jgi:HPt (histidine-containing phosphotransfer) domain-containing protein